MLLDLAIALMLAGFIMLVVNLIRYLHDRRCPECHGSGLGNYFNGDVSGCQRCGGKGYLF